MKSRAQLDLDLRRRTWGGARDGAGRKKSRGQKRDTVHRTRPKLRSYHPVHVVMRLVSGVPRLRQGRTYRVIRRVLATCMSNPSFRVCHVSIQANHIHFLVEAADEHALGAGMQRLNILAARRLNRELGRRGKLFAFRYHATQITNPRQARGALGYVLNNWRHHREDEGCERAAHARLDPYASGLSFAGWAGHRFTVPEDFTPLPVSPPRTWLLRVGWLKHGKLAVWEVPGD